ncbi:MAG: hypothetical protein AAGD22_16860 [Verrucomicrobiota bacterium]
MPGGCGGLEKRVQVRLRPVWWQVMRGWFLTLYCAGTAFGLSVADLSGEVGNVNLDRPQFSISPSRQFIIYGPESETRMAISASAERVKRELLKLLRLSDEWKYEVVIQIHDSESLEPPPRHVAGRVMPVAGGYRFQLDVKIANGFTRKGFNRELIRLLLLEEMLSGYAGAEATLKKSRILPPWLHYGLAELVRYREEGTPSELFSGLLGSNKILEVKDILNGDPAGMDSVTRAAYEGSAAAFVRALLEQDSGAQRLTRTIREFPRYEGDVRPLLLEFYPGLSSSQSSMEKWWALEVASMAQPTAVDFLSVEETQRQLDRALTVRVEDQDGVSRDVSLEDVRDIDKRGDVRRLLGPNKVQLLRLSYRSFPLYRGIIDDYREVLERMLQYKSLGISGRLRKIGDARVALDAALENMDDYLNWYEAARISSKSGAFEEYKAVVDELRREEPMRGDRITRYLDAAESAARMPPMR